MGGLILLFVLLIWLTIVVLLVRFITKKIPARWWKLPFSVGVFIVLLALPLLDEIIGREQFKQLCEKNAVIQADPKITTGKKAYLAKTSRVEIENSWVPIFLKEWNFIDVSTGNTIVRYYTLKASGGWFSRSITEGGMPIIFKSNCEPDGDIFDPIQLLKDLGITQVERLTLKIKDEK